MFTLKSYQDRALSVLATFLAACRSMPVAEAYAASLAAQERSNEPYHALFGEAPAACLRVPTGGGKTIMAAHAVAIAGRTMLDTDAPVALWLTPSDTIRTQTLEALADVRHPYRQALAWHFKDRVQICDLETLQTISPHDVGKAAIVVVATIQSFNVTDTAKRNVYSFFEELALHFEGLPPQITEGMEKVTQEDLAAQPYLSAKDIGKVKFSVANWLHMQRPVVIVDEAHNNRTDRFFKTLSRVNPSCVVEMTATPVPGNNVLYSVSAAELKAEKMIKLPIVLAEHPNGWRECLRDAVLTRKRLEVMAQRESDYVRPIVLVQAEPQGGEAVVAAVKQHLIAEENIPEDQIRVATGTQKELDGVDLFDPACQVRFVITVEALKEGWDCSFAYVLAGLQTVRSAKDVEQLLGRVLRMPYARERDQAPLNQAYAHVVAESFSQAAANITDRMVKNMGFERLDTGSLIVPQLTLPMTDPNGEPGQPSSRSAEETRRPMPAIPDCYIELATAPDTTTWPEEVRRLTTVQSTSQGVTVLLPGGVSSEVLQQVEAVIAASVPGRERAKVKDQFDAHRALRQALRAPAQLGLSFVPVPQLCLELEGHLEVVERETLAQLGEWDLLDQPVQLAGFSITETVNTFEISVDEHTRVRHRQIGAQQLQLNEVASQVSEQDLVRWLDAELRQPDIGQLQMQAWLVKMITHLQADRALTLTALVRAKFQLTQALRSEIERLRQAAMVRGFQGRLPGMTVPSPQDMAHHSFRFEPGQYPARQLYQGSFEFSKHFYPVIHDLRERTASGQISEEFTCAQAIDSLPEVKHWVRNIERQEKFSFWLPTSTDYFYPDFIAELVDGRVLAVEYKGEPYKTNDDSREKMQVGAQWERTSGGRCLFLFAVKRDGEGRDVFAQLAQKIG